MDPAFWKARWESQQTGFHQARTNAYLARHAARLTGSRDVGAHAGSGEAGEAVEAGGRARVLVPLCGKSLDMAYLAALGHDVVGIEVVEQAVFGFFADQRLAPRREVRGLLERFSAGHVEILRANVFDVTRDDVGTIDAVFDRAALIALPGALRSRYAPHLVSLLAPGARILLVTITYDEARMSGPPFCVPAPEVQRLFESTCDIELLEESDVIGEKENARFKARGLSTLVEQAFLLTVR